MATFEDFQKLDIRIGKILSVEPVPKSDKLLKLQVDFGLKLKVEMEKGDTALNEPAEEREIRQVLSGIATYFPDSSVLVGMLVPFVYNLEPRMIMGLESNGMILAVGGGTDTFALLTPTQDVAIGSKVK